MTKDDINQTIVNLQTEEEIIDFVDKRIAELENASIETTVGQNYTTTFKEYISEKTHYKAGDNFEDAECPDLVYDDKTPYINLIKSIKQNGWYSELLLFTIIMFEVYNYLPSDDILGRAFTYMRSKGKRISIKEISENACGFCSERSGLAHNMFKFLGIDSEVVSGYRDSERHAYIIVYPKGYDNEPMVIYDPSFFVNFIKDGNKLSFGYFKALKREAYEKFISGTPLKIDLSSTERNYRKLYGFGDEYAFEGDTPTYIVGLDRIIESPGDDSYDSTNSENEVGSVSNRL